MTFSIHRADLSPLEEELFAAVARGDAEAALAAIGRGAKINAAQRYEVPVDRERVAGRRTPLMAAIAGGKGELARRLLMVPGIALDAADPLDGRTALMLAAEAGDEALVQALLAAGASATLQSQDGRAAAAYALTAGHGEIAAQLLGDATRPAAALLTEAAFRGALDIVLRLIERGADVNAVDPAGDTALVAAAWGGRNAVIEALLERGADLTGGGSAALARAANSGNAATVRLLAARGVPLDGRDGIGWTPLISAAWQGHAETVAALLALGADRSLADGAGKTARDWAREGGHAEIVALLSRF